MYAPLRVFTATMTSGQDSCSVNLPHGYSRLFVQCPTMSTAADRTVYGSADNSTYFPVHHAIASGLTNPAAVLIGSGVTAQMVELPVMFPYVKLVASAVVSGGGTYKFFVS